MHILLISDIHGNFPALEAVSHHFAGTHFDHIINCGDSLVYAPFPNETIDWLRAHNVLSILGNTDKKVIRLLQGKTFNKPRKPEKRIMYESTAEALTKTNQDYLLSLPKRATLALPSSCGLQHGQKPLIGIFHGSPETANEQLFAHTPNSRFAELGRRFPFPVILTGHSHTPYEKTIASTWFINPGSIGRMFDGDPSASCATLTLSGQASELRHYRIPYDIEAVTTRIKAQNLPPIYEVMYRKGRKLN